MVSPPRTSSPLGCIMSQVQSIYTAGMTIMLSSKSQVVLKVLFQKDSSPAYAHQVRTTYL